MQDKLLNKLRSIDWRPFTDVRNIGLYAFVMIILLVAWNGAQTIQSNYQLQQKIARLEQQNKLQKLENENLQLKNKFLETEEFLDMAARRQFGKAAPGERVIVVPKEVALRYVQAPEADPAQRQAGQDDRGKIKSNFDTWRNFLLGRIGPER